MEAKFTLPKEWRAEIAKHGTPLYIDDEDDNKYVLLEVTVEPHAVDGYRAYVETLPLYGKGRTERKAITNLGKIITQFSKPLLPNPHERQEKY